MSKPEYLDQLIEQASKAAGSDYKLAQMLEQPRSAVSMWKAGTRHCPVGDQVLMAELAGLQTTEWLARAVVSQYEGTSKGDKLFRALGKALAVTGAVLVSSGASATGIFSTVYEVPGYFIRCIEVLSERRANPRAH